MRALLTAQSIVKTDRLRLVPATEAMLQAELQSPVQFSKLINAQVPQKWPPELYDRRVVQFVLERMSNDARETGWWIWYNILLGTAQSGDLLIGTLGFKGRPNENGIVEIGYSLLQEFQGQGYATEGVQGLIQWAFAQNDVSSIRAQTLHHNLRSIGVLTRNNFQMIGHGMDEGQPTFIYELTRAAHSKSSQ